MKKLLFTPLLLIAALSCNKPQQIVIPQEDVNGKNDYNAQMSELATVLNKALTESSDFGTTVKIEVEKRFDGDVNVLFSDLVQKDIKVETKSGTVQLSVGDYLNGFYGLTKTNSQSIIDSLQRMYPLLQVAVPVHSDEWDGSYVPKIAYVPYPFDEQNTQTIPAICPDGSWITLDAKNEPDEPVIVLSQNERISIDSTKIIGPVKPTLNPATPKNVKASIENDYILISWDSVSDADSYRIFRKGPNDDNFSYYNSVSGANNTEFKDKSISAKCYYSYYLISTRFVRKNTSIGIGGIL